MLLIATCYNSTVTFNSLTTLISHTLTESVHFVDSGKLFLTLTPGGQVPDQGPLVERSCHTKMIKNTVKERSLLAPHGSYAAAGAAVGSAVTASAFLAACLSSAALTSDLA